jgi:hypothetical protein
MTLDDRETEVLEDALNAARADEDAALADLEKATGRTLGSDERNLRIGELRLGRAAAEQGRLLEQALSKADPEPEELAKADSQIIAKALAGEVKPEDLTPAQAEVYRATVRGGYRVGAPVAKKAKPAEHAFLIACREVIAKSSGPMALVDAAVIVERRDPALYVDFQQANTSR